MAVNVVTTIDGRNPDKDPTDDVVYRQRMMRKEQVDPVEHFKTETLRVEYGEPHKDDKGRTVQPSSQITLRYAYDSPFIFVTIKDNPDWASRPRDLWQAIASDAIEKFFAVKGLQSKMAPKPEDSNRYNLMAEAGAVIEYDEKTIARFQEIEAKNARIRAGSNEYPDHFRPAR